MIGMPVNQAGPCSVAARRLPLTDYIDFEHNDRSGHADSDQRGLTEDHEVQLLCEQQCVRGDIGWGFGPASTFRFL